LGKGSVKALIEGYQECRTGGPDSEKKKRWGGVYHTLTKGEKQKKEKEKRGRLWLGVPSSRGEGIE